MFILKKDLVFESSICSLDFNEDKMAIGGESFLKVWNLNSERFDIDVKTSSSTKVALSPDSRYIAFNKSYNSMCIMNLDTKEKKLLEGFGICSTIYSPDSRFISSTDEENIDILKIYDTKLDSIKTLELDSVECLSYNPHGNNIACAYSRSIDIVNIETLKVLQRIEDGYYITSVSYSPDGQELACVVVGNVDATDIGTSGGINIYDVKDNTLNYKERFKNSVGSSILSYSGNSKYILSTDYNSNLLKVWDNNSGTLVQVIEEFSSRITCISWSRNGKYIAAGSSNGSSENSECCIKK